MRTKGAVQLARTGLTQAEIAERVKVSRVSVANWIACLKKPSAKMRDALQAEFGILQSAWDERFRSVKAEGKAIHAVASSEDVPNEPGEKATDGFALADRTKKQLAKLLDDLELDPDATPGERASVLVKVSQGLALVSRVNGDTELGKRLVQLPWWQRIRQALAAGLKGFPEAAQSVEAELLRAEAEITSGA